MKKATKFNLVLGIINIAFLVMTAVCMFIRGGIERFVTFGTCVYEDAITYFSGITSFWGGDAIQILIFILLAVLVLITLILMISSIAKRQGYFWEPLSILALAILGGLAYRDITIYTNVVNIASDLVEGLKCAALIAFTVGVLVYMIIAVSVISAKKHEEAEEETNVEPKYEEIEEVKEITPEVKEEPVVEEEPTVEEVEDEVEEEPAPVVEKPAPKKAPKKVEEPVVEEPRESKPVFIIDENGEKVYPGRDFEDRLYEADEELLQMYSDLKNEFLSYRKVHTRVSKTNDAFRFEGQLVGKMIVSGKGLKVFLALDPLSVDSSIYHQRDASGKKKFVETPLQVKVKSPLSYRKAKQLIALAMEKVGTVKKTRYTPIDWTKPNAKEKVEA